MTSTALHDAADPPNPKATRQDLISGRILLGLALGSGLWLLWPMFRHGGPLTLDEHGSYWMIQDGFPGDAFSRTLNQAAVPPLSGVLEKLSLTFLGRQEWALRLPSAACYLAALIVTYFLGRQFLSATAGGAAALVLAWHPDVVDEVRIARAYGLLLLLATVHIGCAAQWLRRPASLMAAISWGISAAALLWTHYTSLLLVAGTGVAICISFLAALRSANSRGQREQIPLVASPARAAVGLVVGGLVFLLLVSPLLPALQRMREWGPYLNYMPASPPFWKVIGPLWWLGWPLGLLGAWLIRRVCRKNGSEISFTRSQFWLLAGWSLLPLSALWLMTGADAGSLANPRYRVALAPAGACLIGLSLSVRGGFWRTAALGAAVLLPAWLVAEHPPWQLVRLADPASSDWRTIAERLNQRIGEGDIICVQSGLTESFLVPALYEDRQFLEYVACRMSKFYLPRANPRIGLPFLWDGPERMREFYRHELEMVRDQGRVVWLAAALDTDLNRRSADGLLQLAGPAGLTADEELSLPSAGLWRLHP